MTETTTTATATAIATTTATTTTTVTAATLACGTGRGAGQGRSQQRGQARQGWSDKEDETLVALVLKHGNDWSLIATEAQFPDHPTRSAVRNRYLHLMRTKIKVVGAGGGEYLTSEDLDAIKDAKHGDMYSQEENLTILTELERLGGQRDWKQIALKLPGRSADAVRNHYNRNLRANHINRA